MKFVWGFLIGKKTKEKEIFWIVFREYYVFFKIWKAQ